MAKIGFTKLSLKRKNEVKTITINNNQIEIKQYLPVNEKLDLIARVINGAHDQNNFPNPIKIEVIGTLEMIMAYTNISFTEKQKEDIPKLYDLLEENGVIKDIISQIPEDEYNFIIDGINKTVDAVYTYNNSVLGILEAVSKDYSNLDFDATQIQKKMADPENLKLVRDVLTKLG
jgi:hypothetical protein|nr:MAG TPA: hypothetical protein [Caudoviricetes sp.]